MKLTASLDLAIDALQQRIWYVQSFKSATGTTANDTRLRRTRRVKSYTDAQATLRALRDLIEDGPS